MEVVGGPPAGSAGGVGSELVVSMTISRIQRLDAAGAAFGFKIFEHGSKILFGIVSTFLAGTVAAK